LKVLLDHNLSERLAAMLLNHEVFTAKQLLWDGLKNGDLLAAAEEAGFAAMLTADQNLWYQQNNANRRISLVVVNTNRLAILTLHIESLASALVRALPGTYEFIELVPTRKRRRGQP